MCIRDSGNGEEGYDFEVDNTFVGSATRIAVQKDWSGTPAPGSLPVTAVSYTHLDVYKRQR